MKRLGYLVVLMLARPAPAASPAPVRAEEGPGWTDFRELSDARAARVVAAMPQVARWVHQLSGRRRPPAGLGPLASAASWTTFTTSVPEHAKLAAAIGMPLAEFWRGASLLVAAYGHLSAAQHARKAEEEARQAQQELEKLANDPAVPEETRKEMSVQVAELQLTLKQAGPSDVPPESLNQAQAHRATIKAWIDAGYGLDSAELVYAKPKPQRSP